MNTITSDEFMKELRTKGIRKDDIGFNPTTRKIGYSKTSVASKNFWNMSFYYFYLNDDDVITQCPRGFTKLRGYKISDLDNLISLLGE